MSKRFRVAFSFTGEKRDFVADVARLLAKRFGADRILYDEYHEAEFARSDLGSYLPALYRDQADLVVAILCKDYEKKEWSGLEWSEIYGSLKSQEGKNIMLFRFDRVEGVGLYGLSGFIDLDHRTPDEAAALILERLALSEGRPKESYTFDTPLLPDWPQVAPGLDWFLANQNEARRAFAQLITRLTPFRLLLIHGRSETGKSQLAKQFLGNAFKIPDLTCGRFDFKGSSDMDAALRTFAEHLNVSPPTPGASVSRQLTQIFASLKKAARPTLLIFDTFEMAGEAERWVKENLLLFLIRAPWLRVIIVGQRVPASEGEPWAPISSKPIELRIPTPEDWFEYGESHKPGLTLDFVRQVHQMTGGRSSLLAQLLGPAA